MSELKRVALVHDWLTSYGGAERVLFEMHGLYPQAPVYTSIYHDQPWLRDSGLQVQPSFLQKLPPWLRRHQALLPLMPLAFEAFDLNQYDLVLSSSHACAKGVLTGPQTKHISYLHTPVRYAWDMFHTYLRQSGMPVWKQALAHPLLHYLRIWDQLNTQRIDHLLCNSHFIRTRIAKYYRRDATVIDPPVDVPAALPARRPEAFFLAVGRLVPYKRVDLIVETFNANGWPLKIVGGGPERQRLQQRAGANIEFLGEVSRAELEALYLQARALIFAPLEDFGIVPVEAQGFGCPVIAFGQGGALETVISEQTGLHFREQSVASLQEALEHFQRLEFSAAVLYAHAKSFRPEVFRQALSEFIAGCD